MAVLSQSAGALRLLSIFYGFFKVPCQAVQHRTLTAQKMGYHKVFVYGTLKRGEPNHHLFSDDPSQGSWRFVGEGKTVQKYPLIIGTKYNIPFLLYKPGTGNHVEGEVYEVDDRMLVRLDELEEHPNFYERELQGIEHENGTVDCSVYFLKKFRPELLEQKFYSNYSSTGDHGLPYLDRYLRDPNSPAKTAVYLPNV